MGKKGIAFVVTGSELVCGSVTNTSSPWMADRLFTYGFETTEHRVVSDSEAVIAEAISDAVQRYEVVIITGGLGPTSDDRTRFALARVLGVELEFCESVWKNIEARFAVLNLPIPENNRSQAMLPPNSKVLDNTRGSAAGCAVKTQGSDVFMLPGPPNECRPMFEASVLPLIRDLIKPKWLARKHWFLLGTSEGSIAEFCDPMVAGDSQLEIGYRVEYPYLELKLFASDQGNLDRVATKIDSWVNDRCVGGDTASSQLRHRLARRGQGVVLSDTATGGRLLSRLLFPDTQPAFTADAATVVEVSGLEGFWAGQEADSHRLHLLIKECGQVILDSRREIPHRGMRSLELACEWVCWEWLKALK